MQVKPTFVFTPQKQEFLHDPVNGVHGDCQRAAIASLLGLPLSAVPHFLEGGVDGATFYKRLDEFLAGFNLKIKTFHYEGTSTLDQVLRTVGMQNPGVYYCLIGKSLRDVDHVVICKDENLVHDPHPSDTFLTGPSSWGTWDVEFLTPV